jgi:3-hydroxyisobutyrate dehydrogenase and related beta-hydroxyacid dehydrogenases
MTDIGLFGLGIMGTAMSKHLLAAGIGVVGYDPDAERAEALTTAGGIAAGSPRAVIDAADMVITSLATSAAVEQVCRDLELHGRPGMVVAETSTMPMDVKTACRDLLASAGIVVLDCPLSGTGLQAQTRDVVVYGSGSEQAFESMRPVFDAFSRSVRYLGPFGHGSVMKYIANLLVAIHNVSTAEAFALGIRAGLDRAQLWETIRDGAGNSVIFDKRGRLMIDEAYLPATAKVSMFVKDVSIVREYARTLGLPTPMLDTTVALYDRAMGSGLAEADAAALLSLMKSDQIDTPAREGSPA